MQTQLKIQMDVAALVDMKEVNIYINDFRLDDDGIKHEQFLIARSNNNIVGFGRIREYPNCSELCTLGVIFPERLKTIGSQLVLELIKKAEKKVYLVCTIPDFFAPFGFKITDNYPQVIAKKLFRCETILTVPEKYVVMELNKAIVLPY
ncbi:MAG TPA: GNAT family N-acetyltransferase [Nitrosopumilaceae archaeon]|jgi:N-acetylglutamate synthase-like GNAT family acetyltransferase|nr:GNAT family N-acetyltransferase [Nitrosopumilaceae archaeon]